MAALATLLKQNRLVTDPMVYKTHLATPALPKWMFQESVYVFRLSYFGHPEGGGGGMDQVDSRDVQYGHRCMACSFTIKRKTKFS